MQIYLGQKIYSDADELTENYPAYKRLMKIEIPKELEMSVVAALVDKLPSWQHVFRYLDLPLTRDYRFSEKCRINNHALRLIDCGKWKAAYDILSEEKNHFRDLFLPYNFLQLWRYTSEDVITRSYGGIDGTMMLKRPTDILLWAEYTNHEKVWDCLNRRRYDFNPFTLWEIHDKLLKRRPYMTCIDLDPDDPRVNRTDDRIVMKTSNGCWWMKKGSIPLRNTTTFSARRSCSPPVTNGRMRFDRHGARPPMQIHNGLIKTNQSLIQ